MAPVEPGARAEFCSADRFCWLDPRPQGSTLTGVWVADEADAWAAGPRGAMLRWDGSRWAWVPTGYSGRIWAVWGAARDDVWAVGDAILHFDGVAWNTVRLAPAGQSYRAVHGSGPREVWAVGTDGVAARFDGSSWSEETVPLPSPDLDALDVFVPGNGDVWVIGSSGGAVARLTGGAWQETTAVLAGALNGIWGSGPDDIWVAGSAVLAGRTRVGHHLFHWDGAAWRGVDVPGAEDAAWTDVSGASADEVWLVGEASDSDAPNRARWDGATWTASRVAAPAFAVDVTGNAGFAVGHGGAIAHLASGAWAVQHAGNQHWLNDVAARDGAAWIAARNMTTSGDTTLLRYSGGALTEVSLGVNEIVYGLAPVGGDELWAATYGRGLAHFDGARWTMDVGGLASGEIVPVRGVWAGGPLDVWALLGSEIAHWDGARLARYPVDAEYLERAWGSAHDDVWAVGDVGSAHHWDGATWTKVPLPADALTLDVWRLSREDVWIVGYDGLALHFDGIEWSPVATGTHATLNRVAGDASGSVWAVGDDGTVLEWNGEAFTALDTGSHGGLYGAAYDPVLGLVVAGDEGVLQRSQ